VSTQDDFESHASKAATEVAHSGFMGRIHHALHTTPALVPRIVLVGSIIVFGILLGSKFFSPFALTLFLQQVQIVGIVTAAQWTHLLIGVLIIAAVAIDQWIRKVAA